MPTSIYTKLSVKAVIVLWLLVSGWQTSFAASQHLIESPKVIIQLLAKHNDYQAQLVKRQLEATEDFFRQVQLSHRWPKQLRLNVYDSVATFQEIQLQRWNQTISYSGFYDVNQQLVAVLLEGDTNQMLRRVRHELVHVLLVENYPQAPAWLHEGLAEAFETSAKPVQLTQHSFKHWLHEMGQFSADCGSCYQSAVQGTRFLIQQLSQTPNTLQLLAKREPLSAKQLELIELQWQRQP